MRQKLFYLIKIASTILITCSLGLGIWYISLQFTASLFPHKLHPALWISSLILLAHLIEGAIAAFQAQRQDKSPLRYGIYTFFVGFAGLLELAATPSSSEKPN